MSPTNPVRLSIVTVCWNDLCNVQRTMSSLRIQRQRTGWEHVLVDGASSDGTADWYRSTQFDFPHRVISEPDKGIFDAMNKSLDLIAGDYVIFMNAGDLFGDVDAVGRYMSRVATEPTWGYSKARVVDESGQRIRPDIGRIPYSRRSHLFGIAKLCHQTVVMRADLLRELGGFDLRMGNSADYHLLLKAGSRAQPATWTETDVDYLAGGVSDREIYRSLRLSHRCRVDALALNGIEARLDGIWTALQMAQIWIRKKLKPILGPLYLKMRT